MGNSKNSLAQNIRGFLFVYQPQSFAFVCVLFFENNILLSC